MVSSSLFIRLGKSLMLTVAVSIAITVFTKITRPRCHMNANITICNYPYDNPSYFIMHRTRVINPLNFKTIVQNKVMCNSTSPFLMVLILTYHKQTKLRDGIRSTWGQAVRTNNWLGTSLQHSVNYLFLIGVNNNPQWNKQLKQEASVHGDILLFDVYESYHNVTNKVLLGFQWVQANCPDVRYIMKIDEDIFVHIPRILEKLENPKWNNKIHGLYSEYEPVMIKGKNSNDFNIYPFYYFPPHVKGGLYVMPFSIAVQLLNASKYFTLSNIEDVFITGILARVIGLGRYIHHGFTELEYKRELPSSICYFIINKLAIGSTYTSPEQYTAIWKSISNPNTCERRLSVNDMWYSSIWNYFKHYRYQ